MCVCVCGGGGGVLMSPQCEKIKHQGTVPVLLATELYCCCVGTLVIMDEWTNTKEQSLCFYLARIYRVDKQTQCSHELVNLTVVINICTQRTKEPLRWWDLCSKDKLAARLNTSKTNQSTQTAAYFFFLSLKKCNLLTSIVAASSFCLDFLLAFPVIYCQSLSKVTGWG